jgi:hypothetical protein
MQIIKGISSAVLSFSSFGCDFIDTKKVSYEEIKLASSWSENDQPPSFEQCDVLLELNEQQKCFEENLLNSIYSSFSLLKVESLEPFISEIILVIKIDEKGLCNKSFIKFQFSYSKNSPTEIFRPGRLAHWGNFKILTKLFF